ncbi:hypothetical protein BU23DRAFT_629208 [Bimuria novae-zelandiae CBS 107.79]|uniref:CENP-V/GFA domain-containing protein n=1 Tax=Bimuria novae-zelandiae CBS 107.79 TaxID=1447943 RepID=A0A6A5UK70_9PLEO|nr:hypothetical protein BU23DRAFT_629208 [Bimuria novae-zelandiae CBS 107.79]
MADTITLHASCHCKRSRLSFTVPTSDLPLTSWLCHCSICRHTHGTLCTIHARIPPPEVDLSTFTTYQSSAKVKRLFCSTCGAHMLDNAHDTEGEEWYVAISMVDADESVWNIKDHFLLESTDDGGLSAWLPAIGGETMRKWKRGEKRGPAFAETGDWKAPSTSEAVPSTAGKKLRARCHCGGAEFYISPPRNAKVHGTSPENMKPKDKTKWYALNDVCTSCRLVSGCAVVSWAIPEISHITLADGSPYRPLFGTLKAYSSSPEVNRTFCGTCGAVVTYTCNDRPAHVDVAVGLLEAESGVRAEEWLEWRTHRLAFEEDCKWKNFLQGFKDGLKQYGGTT